MTEGHRTNHDANGQAGGHRRQARDATRRVADSRDAAKPCLVLGYDHSDTALAAAAWAAGELSPDGKLVAVHATRALHLPALPVLTSRERERRGHVLIDELLLEGPECLFDLDLTVEISDEDPVTALTGAARRHHADAIVIGHEKHSRLHRALGTVSSELVKVSSVPVVVVPLAVDGSDRAFLKTTDR